MDLRDKNKALQVVHANAKVIAGAACSRRARPFESCRALHPLRASGLC